MNGYYITDIFDVMDVYDRVDAERWLTTLNVVLAEHMEKDAYKRFVDGLAKRIETEKVTPKPKFDVAGFEAMKLKLKHGL